MPKITVSKKDIEKLIGKNMSTEELGELTFMYLKADIDSAEGDELTFKLEDTNRPDLWSAEGLARALRNLMGRESGIKEYSVNDSNFVVNVEDAHLKHIRPFIGCSIVKKVRLTDELIKSFMQMQDKLDVSFGRKRKKTSIGFYDLDKVQGPVLYTTAEKNSIKFVPLGCTEEMTPEQIFEKHPKGIEYGPLISKHEEVPILIDSDNRILSIPPVINSNDLGNINEKTKNLLIEVTGTDRAAVMLVLGIVSSALAERGGEIQSVKIRYKTEKKEEITPELEPFKTEARLSYIKKRCGLNLSGREVSKILEKMGYETTIVDEKQDTIVLMAPFYRKDIMHPVDIVEDVAIGYGYNNIEPSDIKVATYGELQKSTKKTNLVREIMIGMGHQEVMSFMLTNREVMFEKTDLREEGVVEIANPISSSWNLIRNRMYPIILNFLAANKTVEFPQKVFESGDVVVLDEESENCTRDHNHMCAAISHPKATFTEIKSVLDKLFSDLGKSYNVEEAESSGFIAGRIGKIRHDNRDIGIIGEIHPSVLEKFGLECPVALFELDLEQI